MEYLNIDIQDVIAIGASAILGAIIGLERQFHDKPAGLRTNILIALGACLFTIISINLASANSDVSRIAAQVVTGVGFLGAGSIIRGNDGVHGLTSAAGIWIVAAIGMACGARMYGIAIITTILATIVLFLLSPLTKRNGKKKSDTDQ